MSRFRGNYDYSLDDKNRVNIPAKFRKTLSPDAADTFVIIRSPSGSLRAYPQDLWNKYEDELNAKPETGDVIELKRAIYASLSECQCDAQGRVTLTERQKALAGITKDVALIGTGPYIEIWAAERYGSQVLSKQDDQQKFDELFQKALAIAAPSTGQRT